MKNASTTAHLLFSLGLNGTAAVAFRNRLINGNFAVNQRNAPIGPTAYEPGSFIRDRWQAGSAGCTAACTAEHNGDTTIHIGAGSVLQSIEGGLYLTEGGTYCLSWQGTAIGRVISPGGTTPFTSSPVVASGISPGSNAAVEFSLPPGAKPVSLRLVQIEPGLTPTIFERRDDEMRRCQRYFIRLIEPPLRGVVCGVVANRCGMPLPVRMRVAPIATLSGALQVFDGTNVSTISCIVTTYNTVEGVEVDFQLTSPLEIGRPAVVFVAGQEGIIDLNSELSIR